jgi:hypothetical protein
VVAGKFLFPDVSVFFTGCAARAETKLNNPDILEQRKSAKSERQSREALEKSPDRPVPPGPAERAAAAVLPRPDSFGSPARSKKKK